MKKIIIIFIVLLSFINIQSVNARQNIFTSIQPLAFLIESIAGDKVNVFTMLRDGDNPHTFEPLPSQLTALSKAGMYIKLGSGIEFENIWLDKISKINADMQMIDASKNIKLLKMAKHHHSHSKHHHHKHSTNDPHIWLSVSNAIIITENIKNALIDADIENKDYYTLNADKLIAEFTALKSETLEKLKNVKNRKFMIFHPSFGYFADEFKLRQIAIEIEGKEPTPKQLRKIIDTAKKENIKIIFASENFNTKSAELIAREIGGRIIMINELSKDYINNLKKISLIFQEIME